jgi:hypothetical protein
MVCWTHIDERSGVVPGVQRNLRCEDKDSPRSSQYMNVDLAGMLAHGWRMVNMAANDTRLIFLLARAEQAKDKAAAAPPAAPASPAVAGSQPGSNRTLTVPWPQSGPKDISQLPPIR